MTYEYAPLRKRGADLIERFGQTVTIRRYTTEAPAHGWERGTTTASDSTAKGVMLAYAERLINGETIRAGDRLVLLSPDSPVVPTQDDRLVIGGLEFAVIAVEALNPGGTPLYYKVQVRR